MKTFQCTSCQEWLEKELFIQDKHAKDGIRKRCKPCQRAKVKDVDRSAYNEAHNQRLRKYRATVKGATHTSFDAARTRSREKGLDFDITLEYIRSLWPEGDSCPICKVEMSPKSGWTSPSLDKIDPALGYIKGNVQWLCMGCNMHKGDMNHDELKAWCISTLNHINTTNLAVETLSNLN